MRGTGRRAPWRFIRDMLDALRRRDQSFCENSRRDRFPDQITRIHSLVCYISSIYELFHVFIIRASTGNSSVYLRVNRFERQMQNPERGRFHANVFSRLRLHMICCFLLHETMRELSARREANLARTMVGEMDLNS